MQVSLIIVNYNTYDLVINCINSIIEKTTELDYEIIVVDNFSPNREIENLNSIFPSVRLILNNVNSGFGSGNNLGSKYSSGDYLFFLNSDTILLNNAIKILYDFINKNVYTGICGGNLYDQNLLPTHSYMRYFPGIFREINLFFAGKLSSIFYHKNEEFNYSEKNMSINGYITGADMMISRSLFMSLSGFDEEFFMYYEEVELQLRVKKRNYKIYSVPTAKIQHLEGASEMVSERRFAMQCESEKKYYNKIGKPYLIKLSYILWLSKSSIKILIKNSEANKNLIKLVKKYKGV